LGSALFALSNHSSLVDIACFYQTLLAVGYADNIFLLEPRQAASRIILVFKQTLHEANLQLNTFQFNLHFPKRAKLDMAKLLRR
jgi:hypothetical protein